jgi:hypothetical protein
MWAGTSPGRSSAAVEAPYQGRSSAAMIPKAAAIATRMLLLKADHAHLLRHIGIPRPRVDRVQTP